MDAAQIAQVLGKTRVHIKVILFRARQILGRELRPGQALSKAIPTASQRPAMASFSNWQSTLPPEK
jgi:hypothetical protein